MEPITFSLFKYKFLVDNEKVRFMYGEKQISEVYFADILAKIIIGKIDKESLFRNILHVPKTVNIDAIPSKYDMFIADPIELIGLLKSRHSPREVTDKLMAVSKIGRNYMVDYSGLYRFAPELLRMSWYVKASEADSGCGGCCVDQLDISISKYNVKVYMLLHVHKMMFHIRIS
jgi:hypothetical protein